MLSCQPLEPGLCPHQRDSIADGSEDVAAQGQPRMSCAARVRSGRGRFRSLAPGLAIGPLAIGASAASNFLSRPRSYDSKNHDTAGRNNALLQSPSCSRGPRRLPIKIINYRPIASPLKDWHKNSVRRSMSIPPRRFGNAIRFLIALFEQYPTPFVIP
jgi:hypothetical protein